MSETTKAGKLNHRETVAMCIWCGGNILAYRLQIHLSRCGAAPRPRIGEKICSGCQHIFPTNEFALDKNRQDGHGNYCRTCGRKSANLRYGRPVNADKQFDRVLRFHYNMTAAQYYERLAQQGGVCALCGKPPRTDTRSKRLHVDHDHLRDKPTGEKYIRGLLCSECNHGIGKFGDDPDLMLKAANWVRHHRGLLDSTYQTEKE